MHPGTDTFPDDLKRLAAWSKALAHPARIEILRTLAERGTCICGDVVAELPLSQATVSQHLRVLRDAGLIRGEVDGPRTCYCLDSRGIEAFTVEFSALLDTLGSTEIDDRTCC